MAKLGYWITGPCFTFPPPNWSSVCAIWQYCKLSVIKLTQNIHTEWGLILIFLKCFEIHRWRAATIPGKYQAFSILKISREIDKIYCTAVHISGFTFGTFLSMDKYPVKVTSGRFHWPGVLQVRCTKSITQCEVMSTWHRKSKISSFSMLPRSMLSYYI